MECLQMSDVFTVQLFVSLSALTGGGEQSDPERNSDAFQLGRLIWTENAEPKDD
ncbi:Sirohydrochlorin cobaltochelatase [Clarias magur]|uniref:Sirohydrochlorin cobaltochelatase n=1 Tax=Clarias magur TaxID=1594786 RepID=A0A8J4TDX5_CLAMG|nr:Sirohydrochlorin cobaltochelatase [Clarias magur]